MKLSNEAKVGGMILATLVIAGFFAWIVGFDNPFTKTVDFYVTYNFAGGIEVGSPVRVSGIKVGKVERIEFFVPKSEEMIAHKESGSADTDQSKEVVPLKIKISVNKEAARGVKQDSRFYINLAGIIGERYIEITPGGIVSPQVSAGQVVAGVDPPRFDQLISQSFNLAGKITEILEKNEGDITRSIELLFRLSENLNKTLNWIDKSKLFRTDLSKLIDNLIGITQDVRVLTQKTQSEEGQKTLELLHKLLWRLEPLDSKVIRKFMQDEGVKVHLF